MLQKFGFTQYESQVFEVLTSSALPLDATSVVKYSGVPKSKVYEVLNRLADKGLLLISFHERKKLYHALPLDTTIEKLTKDFNENIRDLKEREYTLKPTDDRVWSLQDGNSIDALLKEKITEAQKTIYLTGWNKDIEDYLPLLEKKKSEGLEVEVLSVGSLKTKLHPLHILLPDEKHEALEQHRLLIIDHKDIVFAGVEQGSWQGITTASSPLVKFFIEFFYHDVALTEITKKYDAVLMQDEEIKDILMKLRY
ncbi:TrmB family transcriptional regulator [Halobacillus campisalis]|uniref:TrmB family transcriptional regulator n=1 Tax=Halobacillus campisalis TaxID=435909 RepID=A0ABW2K782_9BACI|nr:TrmB family transcriptional regulator [Halobacillus campisalis]